MNNGGLRWVVSSLWEDAPTGTPWHWTAYTPDRKTGWAASEAEAIAAAKSEQGESG